MNKIIRQKQVDARKNNLPTKGAYTLIISEIDRLKGNKDPWTQTLQTGDPSDDVVIKVMEKMLKSELERVKLGGEPDYPLQEVLNDLLPKVEVMSEQTAAQRAGDQNPIVGSSAGSSPRTGAGRFADGGDADGERPVPGVGVASRDGDLILFGERQQAGVQTLSQVERAAARQHQAD